MELAEKLDRPRNQTMDEILGQKFDVLDQGFVRVVDYMGTDESIVQAARVSYGKGTKKISEDRGLIRYLLRHSHCYDSETEVLTSEGFVKWPNVTKDMKLGIWDEKNDTISYEIPEYLTCDDFDGEMYSVKHGGVDLLVTPHHKMFVQRKVWNGSQMEWAQEFKLIPANELNHSSTIRYNKIAPMKHKSDFIGYNLAGVGQWPAHDNSRALLKLIGFFIGDGYANENSPNRISFHLIKERKKNFLREVCADLDWELREGTNSDSNGQTISNFSIVIPGIGKLFKELFYNEHGQKAIHNDFCLLNSEDSEALLDGLKNSDGSVKRSTWVFYTSVDKVALAVQRIALHAGIAAHISKNCEEMFIVSMLSRMNHPVINQGKTNTSWEKYTGKVYCAKTRTGILVVRRNGKIVLSGNTTPFEMCVIKFHLRVPMDCWRQWIRHRMSSVNEYSTRYSEAIDACQETTPGEWRIQSSNNKQGSAGCLEDLSIGAKLTRDEKRLQKLTRKVYETRLEKGVAKEQARKDLNLSTYTEAYWKIDLHNLLHFLSLRMDKHAQKEIRDYATIIGNEIIQRWVPLTWEAFNDYNFRRQATLLTRLDKEIIRLITSGMAGEAVDKAAFFGWLEKDKNGKLKNNRERIEFEDKAREIGIIAPW